MGWGVGRNGTRWGLPFTYCPLGAWRCSGESTQGDRRRFPHINPVRSPPLRPASCREAHALPFPPPSLVPSPIRPDLPLPPQCLARASPTPWRPPGGEEGGGERPKGPARPSNAFVRCPAALGSSRAGQEAEQRRPWRCPPCWGTGVGPWKACRYPTYKLLD